MKKKLKLRNLFTNSVFEHYSVISSIFIVLIISPILIYLLSQNNYSSKQELAPVITINNNQQSICSYQKLICSNDITCDAGILTCPSSVSQNTQSNQSQLLPSGFLESADCTKITGWSYNSNFPNTIISVYLYADGTLENGSLIGITSANLKLDDNDVVSLLGPHEFYIETPLLLKDGINHQIYAYGSDASLSGKLSLLLGSPKEINCTSGAANLRNKLF